MEWITKIKAKSGQFGAEAKATVSRASQRAAFAFHANVVGPMEKGFEAARLQTPPAHVVGGVDLRILPKYICYRAALVREKLSLQYALALVSVAFAALFLTSRIEVSHLNVKLREKEFILAPGVLDFTPVAPQSVPESHIQNAAMEFLQTFGTFNSVNITEQYARLTDSMSPELRVQFEMESSSWVARVKNEAIAQILSVTQKEIRTNQDGYYQVTAVGRKDTFANNEHLGSTDIVIEMVMRLVPPKAGKRWYLEIIKLTSQDANAFRVKSGLTQGGINGK
ncbi:hypothetical protein WDW86_03125 [Bdellovibrionota bacterium FG-2]